VSYQESTKASYLVALRVTWAKNGDTITENLILPAATDMCEAVWGECAEKVKEFLCQTTRFHEE